MTRNETEEKGRVGLTKTGPTTPDASVGPLGMLFFSLRVFFDINRCFYFVIRFYYSKYETGRPGDIQNGPK
jgi:hypothetical protein